MHHIMFILFKSLIAVNWDDRSPTLSGSVQHFNFLLVSRIETFFFICNYLKCLKTQHSTQQSWLLSNDCEGGKLRYLHRIVFWNIKLTLICLIRFFGWGGHTWNPSWVFSRLQTVHYRNSLLCVFKTDTVLTLVPFVCWVFWHTVCFFASSLPLKNWIVRKGHMLLYYKWLYILTSIQVLCISVDSRKQT